MKDIDYMAASERAMAGIRKGAFLTVKTGTDLNTMTIGWSTIGFMWRKPVMMVAVRTSRHTFGIIERAGDFTVSVPSGDMDAAIAFCGTKSGRNFDKFKECNLSAKPARFVTSPVIDAPGIHFECRIVYKTPMSPDELDPGYRRSAYPEGDFHSLYFGEIVACYETL
jgi:flavin reductase (DIM6/NTAB) family NADH-FMN oxidoreductase RutF